MQCGTKDSTTSPDMGCPPGCQEGVRPGSEAPPTVGGLWRLENTTGGGQRHQWGRDITGLPCANTQCTGQFTHSQHSLQAPGLRLVTTFIAGLRLQSALGTRISFLRQMFFKHWCAVQSETQQRKMFRHVMWTSTFLVRYCCQWFNVGCPTVSMYCGM